MSVRPSAKRVVKHMPDSFLHVLSGVNGDGPSQLKWEEANVIHTMQVIRVFMREKNTVNNPDTFTVQLEP